MVAGERDGVTGRREQPAGDVTAFESAVSAAFAEAAALLLSKHRDYGPQNIAGAPGGPVNGLRVRLYDKLARLNHLYEHGVAPEHEALRDTALDVANYGVILLLVLDGKWPNVAGG